MKKVNILALVVALCLVLCACGKTNDSPTNSEPPASTGTVAPEQTVEPTVEPTDEPTVEPTDEPTDEPTVEPTDEPADVDFMAFFTHVMENYEMPALDGTPLDADFLANMYPELSEIETAATEVHVVMMTGVACELAMVEVKDAADVSAVEAALQARIDAQVSGGAFYPAVVEVWETSSKIVTSGNYVCMYVGPNLDEITSLFVTYVETGSF